MHTRHHETMHQVSSEFACEQTRLGPVVQTGQSFDTLIADAILRAANLVQLGAN